MQLPRPSVPPHACLPFLWPACAYQHMLDQDPSCAAGQHFTNAGLYLSGKTLAFSRQVQRLSGRLKPRWATPNRIVLDLPTGKLRNFTAGRAQGPVVLVVAPYAGHSSTIADFSPSQSLVRTLMANGVGRVYVTDWKSATPSMRNYGIDMYLSDLKAMIDKLGQEVSLVGLCQGGWLSAVYAARFPQAVRSLVLAGSPLDTSAGSGAIKTLSQELPMTFYRSLVSAGGGRLLGQHMLSAWKSMDPGTHYLKKYTELFRNLDNRDYLRRTEAFARWYEFPLDLPGTFYLQAVEWLFKKNLLVKGSFPALGHRIGLSDIDVPTYLLAGKSDDITPPEQVFAAKHYLGTAKSYIRQKTVKGGHIGLFMGTHALQQAWPVIADWILTTYSSRTRRAK